MTTCAVMMVKNEADIVETAVRNLLEQCDEVIVADNLSTDGTLEILQAIEHYTDGVQIRIDEEVGYWQAKKMTALAREAFNRGHQWVVPADADEIWRPTKPMLSRSTLSSILGMVKLPYGIAEADVFNHYAAVGDLNEPDPVRRLGWRTEKPLGLPKVAVRLWEGVEIAAGNHSGIPSSRCRATVSGLLEVRHFPYRSQEQFVAKAIQGNAAYRATDLDRSLGLHWREYGERIEAEGVEAGGYAWFNRYFRYEHPKLAGRAGDPQPELGLAPMVYDPALR